MIMINKKKVSVLIGILALVVCVGVVNNKLTNDKELSASAGYEEYEVEQLRVHDGEVLVDSVNFIEVPGTSEDAGADVNGENIENAEILNDFNENEEVSEDEQNIAFVSSDNIEELANTDVYFEEVRSTISMDRNEIIAMLSSVIDENKSEAETANATQQKLKIIGYMEQEKMIENLIRNKGFTDALVLITDTSVNVTVSKQELTQSDVAKIVDIVTRETGKTANQIVIQSKY